MEEQRCCNCRFWHHLPVYEDGERGECRRYAPRPGASRTDGNYIGWTETFNNDWCGEHQSTLKDDPLRVIADQSIFIEHVAGYLQDIRDEGVG